MQNYHENLINFICLPKLYEDRKSDSDFMTKKLEISFFDLPIDLDWILENKGFQNLNQSYGKIDT